MANPLGAGLKRSRSWAQTEPQMKVPRRWNDEVSEERRFNLERRVEGVRQELTFEITKRDVELGRLREQLNQLRHEFADYRDRMGPVLAKVDQMYTLTLQENEQLTPVLDDFVEDVPIVDPRISELFKGLEIPMHELSLLETPEAFEAKKQKESERIARQVADDSQNVKLTKRSRLFERSMQRASFSIPDEVQADGAVFATVEGTRHTNEDRSLSFTFDPGTPVKVHAVFDGHGGSQAADLCIGKLAETLQTCWREFVKEDKDFEIANALTVACVKLDASQRMNMLLNHPRIPHPGTTGCISLQIGDRLFVASVGDSRAVLCGADPKDTLQLTYDFKASDPYAQQTVTKRGGTIINSRVGFRGRGFLAITRAIGDEYLRGEGAKKPISPRPKIMQVDLSKLDKREECTLLLMSDGASDVAKPQAMARQINRLRNEGKTTPEIAKALVAGAQKAGSIDDITVGVIPL